MIVALAGDFVAAVGDLAHQFRKPIGDPAKNEERRLDVVPIQAGPARDPRCFRAASRSDTTGRANDAIECPDLEVIFQGDSQHVSFVGRVIGPASASSRRLRSERFRIAWTIRWPASPLPKGFSIGRERSWIDSSR